MLDSAHIDFHFNEGSSIICQQAQKQFVSENVKRTVRRQSTGKAAGPSEIVVEMLKAAGNKGVKIMTKLCNHVVREGAMPR